MFCLRGIVLFALLFLASSAVARKFSRCELARELLANGMPRDKLNDWVCLVESESSSNTSTVGPTNKNGSKDYGLFQINSRYWCSQTSSAGKDCNVRCSDLTNDAISDDVACAKKIYIRHGFAGWYGWRSKCKDKVVPDVAHCL